jgi:hypothetical protein
MRPQLRRAESARGPSSRSPAISKFAREYRDASDTHPAALAALNEAVKEQPTEKQS